MKDFELEIWEKMVERLGREPTPEELQEECERIMAAAVDSFEWPYSYEVDGLEVPYDEVNQ